MAIANALQLEVRSRAVPIRFNFAAHVKVEVAQPSRCCVVAFYYWYVNYAVTLNSDPVTLTFDFEQVYDRLRHGQTIQNLSEIEQSARSYCSFNILTL